MFLLHTLARLVVPFVGDLDGLTADKEGCAIRVYRYQRIRLVQVNAHWMDAMWFRRFQRQGDSAEQTPVALNHGQAVDLFRIGKHRLEGIGNDIGEALASGHCPDRERAIGAKVGVTATLADQEQGARATKGERSLNRMPVAFALA